MNSIEVSSIFNKPYDEFKVTWLIKTTYSLVLQYPEGIDINIPRTYRSVSKLKFNISVNTSIYPEHWKWMIDAVTLNYPYTLIIFDIGKGKTSIEHKDKSLTFALSDDYDNQFSLYLPLEYCRQDFIDSCEKMIDIYASQEGQKILANNRYSNTACVPGLTMFEIPTRYQDLHEILQIHPKEFLVFLWNEMKSLILYYTTHSNPRGYILISSNQIKQLQDWLSSEDKVLTLVLYTPYYCTLIFKKEDTCVHVMRHYSNGRSTFSIPNEHIPKLKDFLIKS